MPDVVDTLHQVDPAFRELVGLLYPTGTISKASPDGADLNTPGTPGRKKKGDAGRKAIAAGLLMGTAAESAAAARSIAAARKAVASGSAHHAAEGAGRLKRFIASPHGQVAEAGLQTANLGVGLAAAGELIRKPKTSDTMAKGMPGARRMAHITEVGRAATRDGYIHPVKPSTTQQIKGSAGVLFREAAAEGEKRTRAALREMVSPKPPPPPAKRSPGRLVAIGAGGGAAGTVYLQNEHRNNTMAKRAPAEVTWVGEISKVDADKRQVFGWCSLSTYDGKPVVDLQGDYIPVEEIEKAAYEYVLTSRKGGDMHARVGKGIDGPTQPRHTADVIESFVVTPEKLAAMGLPPDALPHGWWLGMKVHDDDQWAAVKNGERTGFSVHGTGSRRDMELA